MDWGDISILLLNKLEDVDEVALEVGILRRSRTKHGSLETTHI